MFKKLMGRVAALLFVAAIVSGVSFVAPKAVSASDYVVAVTSFTPTTSAAYYTAGSYPNIAGGASIRGLILTNSGATVQTVSIYDTCTSSTAATLAAVVVLATTGTVQIPIEQYGIMKLTNPGISKSSAASDVYATFLYQ